MSTHTYLSPNYTKPIPRDRLPFGAFWRNDISGALTTILENVSYDPSVDEAKLIILQTLLTILNTTKSIVIKSLPLHTQDTLMKYL